MPKTVSQRRFIKGLSAASAMLEQPPQSVSRISNLVYSRRGGLITADGNSTVISSQQAPIAGLFASPLIGTTTVSGPYRLFATHNLPFNNFGDVTGLAGVGAITGGGTLNPATAYTITVTVWDGAYNVGGTLIPRQTAGSTIVVTPGGGNNSINLSWNLAPAVAGYIVYMGTGGSAIMLASSSLNGVTNPVPQPTIAVTILAITGSGFGAPPGGNTTQQGQMFATNTFFNVGPIPSFSLIAINPNNAAFAGSYGSDPNNNYLLPSGFPRPTACGGYSGGVTPIPQIVGFNNKIIFALGNGIAPQVYDNNLPSVQAAAITNTFSAQYPNWLATTQFVVGANILPAAGNAGAFVFQCVQGGTSGGGAPTWPQTVGQEVADNNIIWKNLGVTGTSPAPRGAAHAIVYAGSLWLGNTSPATTIDSLDGPTVVKMSDVNNPTSWNPLNVAFLGKDDGTQIMGLATFTIAESGISPVGSLVVFKEYKTYQINGVFGATNFSVQEAQTDMGCAAPRSIQFIPGFGIVRLTHLGIAVFDGVKDRLISEEIRPYLFGGVPDITQVDWGFAYLFCSAQSVQPPMYILGTSIFGNTQGAMTRLFCYDLVLKAWTIIDLPTANAVLSMTQARIPGSLPITMTGAYNSADSTIRRMFGTDSQFAGGVPVSWSVRTAEILGKNSNNRIYFRRFNVRGSTTQTLLTINAVTDSDGQDSQSTPMRVFLTGSSEGRTQFLATLDVNNSNTNTHITLSGSGDIQINGFDWDLVPMATGVTPSI